MFEEGNKSHLYPLLIKDVAHGLNEISYTDKYLTNLLQEMYSTMLSKFYLIVKTQVTKLAQTLDPYSGISLHNTNNLKQ